MADTARLARDGPDWPNREFSRTVHAGGLAWHVQVMGQGPVLLLIHGTGASTHTWRDLMPLLARQFQVVAMDLPGHAHTDTPPVDQLSLPGMARALAALVSALAIDVVWIVGHSAGAAIAARLVLDQHLRPCGLVGINAALLPLGGLPGLVFPPVARLMAATPITARLFARRNWDAAAVRKLIAGTGSRLDDRGVALYGQLLRDPRHAAGALQMMARWDLPGLERDLTRLTTPLTLIVGLRDLAVPPADASRVCRLLPRATPRQVATVAEGGHLVHEERPLAVAGLLFNALSL